MDRKQRSRVTILQMLHDRGYDAPDDPNAETLHLSKGGRSIKVMWPDEANISAIKRVAAEMEAEDIHRVILVVDSTITPSAKIAIRDLQKGGFYIEIFTVTETQVNISHNDLVPPHSLCTTSTKESVLRAYAVQARQIPQIKKTDPMARYLGAMAGNMIQIVRDSETMPGKKMITYRMVVA